MKFKKEDYENWSYEARRGLGREIEQTQETLNHQQSMLRMVELCDSLVQENEELREQQTVLQEQLAEERRQRADLEMKMAEMSKLSAGVAKKASEDNLLKALRTYVNRSKRKTSDKRAFAKSATLEIANANGVLLPEDLAAAIDALDDEQTETKVVNVAGNYNDIHDNGTVNKV